MTPEARAAHPPSITAPGLLLGVGIGGMFDGIVLHQVLQWHHMLSSEPCCPTTTVRGIELNTVADGTFHLVAMTFLLAGLSLLWRRIHGQGVPWVGRQVFGLTLMGWGLFNLVEGTIDHHLLGLHHVHPGRFQLAYDLGFLVIGALLVATGWILSRTRPLSELVNRLIQPLPANAP